MNCRFAIAVVLATSAAAITAFADDITMDPARSTSSASYSAVMSDAELWEQEYNLLIGLTSPARTRAEVTAEYVAARDQVAAFNGEDSGSSYLAQQGPAGAVDTRLAGAAR
jgi:hypothetical protein